MFVCLLILSHYLLLYVICINTLCRQHILRVEMQIELNASFGTIQESYFKFVSGKINHIIMSYRLNSIHLKFQKCYLKTFAQPSTCIGFISILYFILYSCIKYKHVFDSWNEIKNKKKKNNILQEHFIKITHDIGK